MLNIEIKGVQFSNKGAELMLVAIIEQLDKTLHDYHITLAPGRLLPYQKRAELGAWQKLSLRRGKVDLTGIFSKLPNKLLNVFKRYGIVTEKEVDVILDASGFAYGQQWGTRSLVHAAKEISRFKQQSKKYIFLPQAFGPFETPEFKSLALKVFSQANLVFPRDKHSLKAITQCHRDLDDATHIIQSPDFTCLVEPEPYIDPQQSNSSKKQVCFIPNNKMVSNFHHKNAEKDHNHYVDFFVQTGKFYQQQGWQVVLLNHEGEEDQLLCQKIAEQLSETEVVSIQENLTAVGIKSYIASVDAVISSRFHGCVSALTQGIPCLSTSWSHKYEELFHEYGVAENVLDFKVPHSELIELLSLFNRTLAEQKQQCLAHAKVVKEHSRHMWKQVFLQLANDNES